MPWEVRVTGPQAVISELASDLRQNNDPLVRRDGDHLVLSSPRFDELSDANSVREQAQSVVAALSGISRMLLQSSGPLTVMSVTELRPDGSSGVFIQIEGEVLKIGQGRVFPSVTHADGTVEEHRPLDPVRHLLSRAWRDPAAARALRLRSEGTLSWSSLYRLYEVIEEAVGGEDAIVSAQWSSRTMLTRFTRSANSVAAAGDDARHGVERAEPPPKPLTLEEARALIDGLLQAWLGGA